MYTSLNGKVALVTGAGAGIGRAIALRMAREGCLVAVNDLDGDALSETLRLLQEHGCPATAWRGDMTSEAQVSRVVQGVISEHGGVDILVNNVGLFTFGDLASLDTPDWDRCFDINVKSTFLCTRAAARTLSARHGVVVNISSGAGKIGGTGAGGYSAAKWAVIGLTKSLANELAPQVRVNAVCPGIIETRMDANYVLQAAVARRMSPDEFVADRLRRIPLGRNGTPDDVANAVAFLCSDQACYTTGEAMNVSGGMVTN